MKRGREGERKGEPIRGRKEISGREKDNKNMANKSNKQITLTRNKNKQTNKYSPIKLQ